MKVFSEKSEILISQLQKEVGSKNFDVCPYITKCTLDIICGERVRRDFHEAVYPIILCTSEECIQTFSTDVFCLYLFYCRGRHGYPDTCTGRQGVELCEGCS